VGVVLDNFVILQRGDVRDSRFTALGFGPISSSTFFLDWLRIVIGIGFLRSPSNHKATTAAAIERGKQQKIERK
jgi:hypothetical protein